jgi:regulatory protein
VNYLGRELRERGWEGDGEAPVEALADRFVQLGYIDDRAFALSRARSLTGRGYGGRRVRQDLASSGIGEEDAVAAHEFAADEAVAAALKFAERRSLGPYAESAPDRPQRERALAAMVRAGHSFSLARAIVDLKPGEIPDSESLVNVR